MKIEFIDVVPLAGFKTARLGFDRFRRLHKAHKSINEVENIFVIESNVKLP